MHLSVLLSALGGLVVLCAAASRVPAALADLLRACIPAVHAARELQQVWRSGLVSGPDHTPRPPRPPLPSARCAWLDSDLDQDAAGNTRAAGPSTPL